MSKSYFTLFALTLLPLTDFASSSVTFEQNRHQITLSESIHHSLNHQNSYPTQSTPDYTNLPSIIKSVGERVFIFSPHLKRWAAYDQYGFEVARGPGEGGADYCAEINEPCRTPVGEFRVTRKKGADCESSQFPVGEGGAPMPYCTFFKNGNAIHGSPYLAGRNSSHGCIRVLTGAARWLSLYFLKRGTKVITLPY